MLLRFLWFLVWYCYREDQWVVSVVSGCGVMVLITVVCCRCYVVVFDVCDLYL